MGGFRRSSVIVAFLEKVGRPAVCSVMLLGRCVASVALVLVVCTRSVRLCALVIPPAVVPKYSVL